MSGASLPTPEESSYYGVDPVTHNFTTLALGHIFCFFVPRASYFISPRELDLSESWEESPFTYFLRCPS